MKLLICDPVCAQKQGHNFSSILQFANYLTNYYSTVQTYGSKELLNTFAPEEPLEGVIPYFTYTYFEDLILHAENQNHSQPTRPSNNQGPWRTFLSEWEQLFAHNPARSTTVILPSADIDSLMALQQLAKDNPAVADTKLIIRLIGVMEYAHKTSKQNFITILSSLISSWKNILVCTETRAYSHLIRQLNPHIIAHYAPHPPLLIKPTHQAIENEIRNKCLTVCCPGSNRIDKGYKNMPSIIEQVNSEIGIANIKWVVQDAPISQIRMDAYDVFTRLNRAPNCEILPPRLEAKEITDIYLRSDVTLMPYCNKTYRFRGSAILPESMSHGIPVVSSRGTAFGPDIALNSCGILAGSVPEYAFWLAYLANDFKAGQAHYFILAQNTKRYLKMQQKAWEAIFQTA
jgi:hypothetical protein